MMTASSAMRLQDLIRRKIIFQFFCYTGVGAIGTITHYIILISLVQIARVAPVHSSIAGFIGGALINYLLNYRYTFSSNKRHSEAATKFFAIAIAGLILNSVIMILATTVLNLHYILSQIAATGLVLIWNFTCNRIWTFKQKTHAK